MVITTIKKIIILSIIGFLLGFLIQAKNNYNVEATQEYEEFEFPLCIDQEGNGDWSHYDSGLHQIYGDGLQEGQDDVYSLENGNFLQCFCPLNGEGIQTDWYRTEYGSVNGSQWNLGDYQYDVVNFNYSCNRVTPTPTERQEQPTPTNKPSQPVSEPDHNSAGSVNPPRCIVALPDAPRITEVGRIDLDTVFVKWNVSDINLTHQGISYGYSQDNLPYGIAYLPKESREIDLNSVNNSHVWIQVHAYNGGECRNSSIITDP